MDYKNQLSYIINKVNSAFKPPPDYSIDLWADNYRQLSPEASAEAGQWRTDRVPFQREIMRVITDPDVETVVFMKSAQVGATEMMSNIVGYYVDQEPSPILIMQPTLNMAQTYSKDRLAPMLRDTPKLRDKVKDPRTRDAENTTLHKKFTGGHITVVGANSASGLASRPVRILLCDETDRYPPSAGTEGDPINLARKRTTTFWNRKIILASTPTVKDASRIENAFNLSDQRHYHVPCPECNHEQKLRWKNVSWQEKQPETATLACESCGAVIPESKKQWMLKKGRWIAENPESKIVGFHINELYSPFRKLEEIVSDFLEAKDHPEMLQTFINTSLGECWEENKSMIDTSKLMEKCENYNDESIPDNILFVTAGVDTQKDRLEVQTIGWGDRYEAWVIEYNIIWGDPSTQEVWEQLDMFLKRSYTTEAGRKLPIKVTCIDSGGHHTQNVYDFCRPRQGRMIFPVKGQSQSGKPIAGRATSSAKQRVYLYPVGTDTAKEFIFSRLNQEEPLIHFPNTVDEQYFAQLTSERQIKKIVGGQPKLVWYLPKGKRNEALDTFVYALAAVYILAPNFKLLTQEKPEKAVIKRKTLIEQRYNRNLRKNPRNFVYAWKDKL
jgi:phage terminase large subunit GpA-like protein